MWIAVRRTRITLIAGTAVFTLAICAMHFTGMTPFALRPNPALAIPTVVMAPATLAVSIAATAFLIIIFSLASVLFDRQRISLRALKTTTLQLEQLSNHLQVALEEANTANRAKATFFAAMTHELRTPLNAIIGFSEMLKDEFFAPLGHPRNVEYARDIHASGLRLLSIFDNVLDMSRLDAGNLSLQEEEIDVEQLIYRALHAVDIEAEKANVHLTKNIESGLPKIHGDVRRLEQALVNLLTNAIKFTRQYGSVNIHAHRDTAGLYIEVADTGIGIAEENIANVLTPFVQVDNSLARKYEGAGLGLPIAKKLVEMHGGTLGMKSTLNVGTTATITLPVSRLVESTRTDSPIASDSAPPLHAAG